MLRFPDVGSGREVVVSAPLPSELRASLEESREKEMRDPMTGLANRRRFMDTLAHRVEDREHMGSGVLLLVQLNDFKAYNQKPYQPIRPETRRSLAEYFAPHNEKLYEYLGRDFGWR